MNGVNGSKDINTMWPIYKHKMVNDKKACHSRWVANIWLQKENTYCVRMIAAGNFLEGIYTGELSTKTANIEIVKIHTNNIISSIEVNTLEDKYTIKTAGKEQNIV